MNCCVSNGRLCHHRLVWLVGVKFYEKPPTTQERVVKPKTQRSTVLNYSGMLWMLEKPFAEEL
jgi:hypothetical protein